MVDSGWTLRDSDMDCSRPGWKKKEKGVGEAKGGDGGDEGGV